MGYVKPPKPSIEIITPPKIPLKPLNSRLGVSTQANRRLEVKLEMTYWSFRSKARPIFGASRYSSVRIQLLSIRGDLASRSESSTFSRASSSPPNGILRAPGPPRSSHEQRGLADAPIAWDSNFRSFTSPASLRCGWSDVPRQPSVSMTTAAACRVCKPSGVIGLPLINCRFFGRSRAVDTQRLINEAIVAKTVMLVLERPDGSTETTVVSRKQALEAAQTANLDLVQVNSKSDPVVCRLMNAKVDEYRRKRLAKANSQRKQQKKEIRMKGMIASHDFERKVNDVKRHLEKGDVVKVVFEASTAVLSRSLNCLDELQAKFEEHIDPNTVTRLSHGASTRSRREITCTPKSIKATTKTKPKPKIAIPKVAKKEGVLDEQVLEQLKAGGAKAESTTSNDSEVDMEDSESLEGGDSGNVDESLSADKGQENEMDVELDPEEMLLWEMEDCGDFGEENDGEFGQVRERQKNRKGDIKTKDVGSGKGSRKASIRRSGVEDDEISFDSNEDNEGFASGGGGREGGSRRDRPIKRREGGAGRSIGGFERKTRFGGQGRGGEGAGSSSMGSRRVGGFRERSVSQRGREENSRTARMPPPVRSSPQPPSSNWRGINGTEQHTADQTEQVPQYRWDRIKNNTTSGVKAARGINGAGHQTGGSRSTRSRLPPKVPTESSEMLDKEPHRRAEGGSK